MSSIARRDPASAAASPSGGDTSPPPVRGGDNEPDLESVTAPEEFAAALKAFHIRAGMPSYRQLEAAARRSRSPLPRSTIADMLAGRRMPRKWTLEAYLRACGAHPDEIATWMEVWERVKLEHGHRGDTTAVPRPPSPGVPLPMPGAAHSTGSGFWQSLTDDERASFATSADDVVYPVGTVLWQEGQAADDAVVIRSGSVRVSVEREGRQRILAFRGSGDIIGERAALLLGQRSATVVAMDTVRGLRMSTRQFASYLSDNPRVVAVLERELYDRMTEQTASGHPPPHVPPPPPPPPVAPGKDAGATVGAPSWAGQNCTIFYTDIAGFSSPDRDDVDRLEIRRTMYEVLREAFDVSKVPWDSCHIEDRGDGALIIVPPDVPTAAVIDPAITWLAARLRRHNHRSSRALRIQLRVAAHVGPVMPDPPGVSGWALIRTARLLDARPLKDRLASTGADLGFITSQFVYESVIAHGPGQVNPADYESVACTVKKLRVEGWMRLFGDAPVPAAQARPHAPGYQLSDREAEVVGMATFGLGVSEIADDLNVSARSVRNHLRMARDKLARGGSGVAPGAEPSATALTLRLLDERLAQEAGQSG
ncbi:cyclic nucleotide-binding domain-containing protein [Actinomadura sp. 9N215]|uniref:cyclic nucleotide-binding domain-containing protein n=1 Tax=Actinomadura sp. 9N215 TaxID=3375150 RepID=UPI00378B4A0B